MGLEIPSQSLGYAHLCLAALLLVVALCRPQTWVLVCLLAVGFLGTLTLPVLWVGPIWAASGELSRFIWGFFLSFASSLGIPFALGAVAVTVLARRSSTPSLWARVGWPVAAYFLGLLLSIPVSFNYALAYPLLR